MFEAWTNPQKRVAKKIYLWWAFDHAPENKPAVSKAFALYDYMTALWNGTASSLDEIRTCYANECMAWEYWKITVHDDDTFFDAVWSELLMD